MSSNRTVLRRSRRTNAGQRQERLHVSNLTATWRRLYLHMNHCRLQKCIETMRQASQQDIDQLKGATRTSFVAMAISAASAYRAREDVLLEYAQVVVERGLDPNDEHNGNSALTLACYHGYLGLVEYLLELGCFLYSQGSYGNAVEASVRNGRHNSLALLLERRPQQVSNLFANDAFSRPLRRAIFKKDVKSVRMLTTTNGITKPTMSDRAMSIMKYKNDLFPLLRELYPLLPNVKCWSKTTHWSFPTSDRHALNILWYTAGVRGRVFPFEIWLIVFCFVGRGWFAMDPSVVVV